LENQAAFSTKRINKLLYPSIRFIEFVGSFIDLDVMTHYSAGLGTPRDNRIAKILVVFFHPGLPAANGDPLVEELGYRKRLNALLGLFAFCAWIRSYINTDDANASDGIYAIAHNSPALGLAFHAWDSLSSFSPILAAPMGPRFGLQ
jgi:hypothetical protein